MVKVALIDDQALLRSGLRAILEADSEFTVVGEAGDGAAGVEMVLSTHPDVVLMDIQMPKLDGLEATRRLVAGNSRARILILTTFDDDENVVDALRAGAAGFMLKDADPRKLVNAIRTIAAGDSLLAPAITQRLIQAQVDRSEHETALRERLTDLSDRELETLRCLARGLSNAEIGKAMFLSEATVKTHVTNLLGKLGLRSRVQAVVLAYESGFVRTGEFDPDRL